MPISGMAGYEPNHWTEVREVLERAIETAGFKPQPVWEGGDADIIHDRIVNHLYSIPIAVCDASGLNPNVMLELGMRLSFAKPVVIVSDDLSTLPFDTRIIEHMGYPRDLHIFRAEKFIEALADKIKSVHSRAVEGTYKPFIKNFGPIEPGSPGNEEKSLSDYIVSRLDQLSSSVATLSRRVGSTATQVFPSSEPGFASAAAGLYPPRYVVIECEPNAAPQIAAVLQSHFPFEVGPNINIAALGSNQATVTGKLAIVADKAVQDRLTRLVTSMVRGAKVSFNP
jgi:hypothetical protein